MTFDFEKIFSGNVYEKCIQKLFPVSTRRGYILDSLFGQGTITNGEKQQIERLPERQSAAALVDLLYSCQRPKAIAQFLEILSNDGMTTCKWITDEVHKTAQEKVASSLTPSLRSPGPVKTTAADEYEAILRQCLEIMYARIIASFRSERIHFGQFICERHDIN